jgi:hypothetical protein
VYFFRGQFYAETRPDQHSGLDKLKSPALHSLSEFIGSLKQKSDPAPEIIAELIGWLQEYDDRLGDLFSLPVGEGQLSLSELIDRRLINEGAENWRRLDLQGDPPPVPHVIISAVADFIAINSEIDTARALWNALEGR